MKNLYQKIVDTVPLFFFVWDGKKNETVFISEKFYDYTLDRYYVPETPREDLRQYIAEESQPAYDHYFTNLADDDDSPNHIELKANHLPGIEWIKLSTFPVMEQGSQTHYTAGHISDITHTKQHTQLLESQVDSIDTIIFMLAHELSAPITNMMGLAEYLKNQAEGGHHIQPAQLYETIFNRGGEVLTLARGMVSLLNLQFNKESYLTESISLKPFIEQLVEDFYHKPTAKNITLSCSSVSEDITVEVQAEKFSMAVKELLVFLLKMAEENEKIAISTPTANQPGQVELCITSTASNLPKAAIQSLIDRSSRLDLSDVKGRKARGLLELVITQEIVTLHGGHLALFEMPEEQGFVITLPAHQKKPNTSHEN